MRKCERMICVDVKMKRCEDESMTCVDVKMRRCEGKKMIYRPPVLEEPFAQTLSGKNGEANDLLARFPARKK